MKVSDSKTYPLKNEERMKNDEERTKTFTDLLTETSRKRYGSTSAWIFFTETIFFTQNSGNTSPGASQIIRTTPFNLFIGKRRERLPPSSPRSNPASKNILKAQFKILKLLFAPPPILISSPHLFRNLRKSYGSLTEAYRN